MIHKFQFNKQNYVYHIAIYFILFFMVSCSPNYKDYIPGEGKCIERTAVETQNGDKDGEDWICFNDATWYEVTQWNFETGYKKIIRWFKNGNKNFEVTYSKKGMHGKLYSWYIDGKKYIEFYYIDGKLDGLQQSWYSNGQKAGEDMFSSGKLHGKFNRWHSNGKMMHLGQAVHDKFCGIILCWDLEGNPERCEFSSQYLDDCSQTESGLRCKPC